MKPWYLPDLSDPDWDETLVGLSPALRDVAYADATSAMRAIGRGFPGNPLPRLLERRGLVSGAEVGRIDAWRVYVLYTESADRLVLAYVYGMADPDHDSEPPDEVWNAADSRIRQNGW